MMLIFHLLSIQSYIKQDVFSFSVAPVASSDDPILPKVPESGMLHPPLTEANANHTHN